MKNIIIKAAMVDLDYANTETASLYGTIVNNWMRSGTTATFHIEIPVNSTAKVYIPATDVGDVTEGGSAATGRPGITYLAMDGIYAVFRVQSGIYDFRTVSVPSIEEPPPPLAFVAGEAQLTVACDNGYEIYLNGALLGSGSNWKQAGIYPVTLADGENVIGIKGTDAGGSAALICELTQNEVFVGSDENFKVSLTGTNGWNTAGFDDSSWLDASVYGSYGISPWKTDVVGMPADTPASWIWSNDNNAHNEVYVRYVIPMKAPTETRYEAEDAVITSGSVLDVAGASGGKVVDGSGGFKISWNVTASAGTHDLTFAVSSYGTLRSMGVYLTVLNRRSECQRSGF
ncbi:MAG: hypothetical protein HC901_00115 [Bdellovibrionaceae bacterium]|nr:hypothetical protein [Pseudobdellovibrionaceae bacterium]